MIPYFYRSRIDSDLLMHILVYAKDFDASMRSSGEAFCGMLVKCAILASSSEPIAFVEFPDDESAMAWKTFYYAQTGVQHCTLERQHTEKSLGDLKLKSDTSSEEAQKHRQ